MKKKLLISISIILVIVGSIFIYLNNYYHSEDEVNKYLISNELVEVKKTDDGYLFDGKGSKDAIVFYPGAKVEYTSYAPLMSKIASNGIDVYLVKMPFNIAFLGKNKADNIISDDYDNWYIMGHSLGGVVASSYASGNDKIKGIILLASYPTKKIPDNIRLLSIYGTNDEVLNMKKYEESTKYFPSDSKKVEINGGNHANYGNYGKQKKDKESTISREEQQNKTVEEIINFINVNQ